MVNYTHILFSRRSAVLSKLLEIHPQSTTEQKDLISSDTKVQQIN